jgi:Xaa-Pro aminopeptidase
VNPRVDRLRGSVEEPLLVSTPANVRYLTGFSSSNAAVLVEPERIRVFSDFRYSSAGRALERDGVEFIETNRNLYAGLAELLEGRIGFEANAVTYAQYETLAAGGLELVPRRDLVESLRVEKEDGELEAIRAAAAVTSAAFERFAQERFTGRSERDLAWRLDELFHELGAKGPAFETIVAGGPNAALPHGRPTEREIEPGETVVVDAGALLDGYCSDCTRTFATGPLPGDLRRAYAVCRSAQEASLGGVRAGADARGLDGIARRELEEGGFEVLHGLGHGVGLEVHELPAMRPTASGSLEPANVVTVEPGVYLAGQGGVRIEDLVIVTENGAEVLTPFTKELLTLN